ncbi:MAG: tRNA (guanosine(46)-N7)-methyltransferase TrmB [Gammaproteobacteria bacterium]|jgi:tRNA (guanine-N7-)-methyltransferase|nr:tRNA (guanosine(46)-N7)-methyltransferase TrmB [Gammaproteobacteria bacterium]MBT7307693.1 tRNA (guanosine(46)-N7)-methyltransferase TrmB [Gammaproteobacteria bacterium]
MNITRPIRSFVRREGRITRSQRSALDRLWHRYGVDTAVLIQPQQLFNREAPLHLEIGFGMGDSLLELALADPNSDFLGIEVHRPGVGHLLDRIDKNGVDNVRLLKQDAVEVLSQQIPPNSLDSVMLFFPDPWHKKRHHKRRIVQPPFIELIQSRLKSGGCFHLATDWEEYAQWMMKLLSTTAGFQNQAGSGQFSPRPVERPITKFEKRGLRLGHGVWDLLFIKS